MTNTVSQHPKAAQMLGGARFLHPREMNDELTARLVNKMETLAREAYLDGRRRGFQEGWLNGATVAISACLLLFILSAIAQSLSIESAEHAAPPMFIWPAAAT